MNERIQALMEQAMDPVDPYALEGESGPRRLNEIKFAELIIKESIKVMMENDYHGEWLGEKLKEYFGVEG